MNIGYVLDVNLCELLVSKLYLHVLWDIGQGKKLGGKFLEVSGWKGGESVHV